MKKIITVICAAALLSSLTGCNNETASDGGTSRSTPESASTDSNGSTVGTPESSESAPESTDSVPETPESTVPENETGEPTLEELIGRFTPDVLTLPDGTELNKTEAVWGVGGESYAILKFNVGVMRYCDPVFQSSYDDPDSFDWENYTFLQPVEQYEDREQNIRVVKAGDVLENGMTVKSAYIDFESGMSNDLYYKWSKIELEGEQTVEGILYLREEDNYAAFKDHLELYIDATKCEYLPMHYQQYGTRAWTFAYHEHKVAVTVDGCYYDLGSINECTLDLSDVFLDSPFAKVKAVIKDPVLKISESAAPQVTAELVNIEVLR